MAKTSVADWDTTAADNTDIGGIPLAENVMKPPAVNDAFREMMAQIKVLNPLNKDGSNVGDAAASAVFLANATNLELAEGDLLYVGASGVPARLPKGSAGQVLRQNAGLTAPEWHNPPVTLLASGTFNNTAALDITDITDDYQKIEIVLNGVVAETDGDTIGIRVSTDGGANFDAGTGYNNSQQYTTQTGAPVSNGNAGASLMILNGMGGSGDDHRLSNNSERQFSAVVEIVQPADASRQTQMTCKFSGVRRNGVWQQGLSGGHRITSQADNALRLLCLNGNIASGDYAVYGYRR